MGNELAKALVINTATGVGFPVMYNPEEFKLDQGNNFAEIGIPGLNASPVQYVRGRTRTLAMELFFDSYETGTDVREHTAPIVALLDKDPAGQAPPVLLFSLGRFQLPCVLVDAGQRFTMFLRDGTPVRSVLSVRFQEYVQVDIAVSGGLFFGSPIVSAAVNTVVGAVSDSSVGAAAPTGTGTVHTVIQGDTLSALAGTYLGDAGRWREIARVNGMDDPFALVPGRPLVIPPRTSAGVPAGGGVP
ncbi:CIS tube protein [Kitasatospora azatica]|uniref:CIS tube protein n=1 Tax=Kitasatospora azatica TaxID=58347 RepID=UPI00068C1334|nr:LysM peptidoglycan-binding domain-containing protein [Kitasatospora azatica]